MAKLCAGVTRVAASDMPFALQKVRVARRLQKGRLPGHGDPGSGPGARSTGVSWSQRFSGKAARRPKETPKVTTAATPKRY